MGLHFHLLPLQQSRLETRRSSPLHAPPASRLLSIYPVFFSRPLQAKVIYQIIDNETNTQASNNVISNDANKNTRISTEVPTQLPFIICPTVPAGGSSSLTRYKEIVNYVRNIDWLEKWGCCTIDKKWKFELTRMPWTAWARNAGDNGIYARYKEMIFTHNIGKNIEPRSCNSARFINLTLGL